MPQKTNAQSTTLNPKAKWLQSVRDGELSAFWWSRWGRINAFIVQFPSAARFHTESDPNNSKHVEELCSVFFRRYDQIVGYDQVWITVTKC